MGRGRALLPGEDRRFLGSELVYVELIRAELNLGRGRHDEAAAHLARLADPVAASAEPQWHGAYGALLAELRRRQGDLDGARAAVDDALDRIEFCTEDAARLARVSAAGVTVEADRAQRGRDLGDDTEVARALGDIEAFVLRVEAAAEVSGLPVEAAWLATARADAARAAGEPAAELWRESAAAWEAVERAYRVAAPRRARPRPRSRPTTATRPRTPPAPRSRRPRRLGAGWLAGEIEGLVARARLRVGDGRRRRGGRRRDDGDAAPAEDPFGLTPRERQVLALVAARRDEPPDRRGSSTWPRRPRASTCRGSSPSSTCAAARRRPRSRTGSGSRTDRR